MTSRADVLRSLLRSTARSAVSAFKDLPLTSRVQRAVHAANLKQTAVSDAQLSAAVARVPHVAAATVRSGHGRVRVDASLDDGTELLMAVQPDGIAFAPGGAKELAFTVDPPGALARSGALDVVGAIAGEIARALWRPALTRAPRGEQGGYVSHLGGKLVVDLRSVPEVRWALRQRIPALLVEAIRARAIEIRDGRLIVTLAIEGLRP